MNYYIHALTERYSDFRSRSTRSEYWFFALFNIIVGIVVTVLDIMFGIYSEPDSIGLLGGIYGLLVFIPGLAIGIRRLHDTNKSGWWTLILFIPIIGAIVYFVFMCTGSDRGDNRFGASPNV